MFIAVRALLAAIFMVGEVLMDFLQPEIMSRVVVMAQGSIVEQGTHEELLARLGKYYTLYMTQFSGFVIYVREKC